MTLKESRRVPASSWQLNWNPNAASSWQNQRDRVGEWAADPAKAEGERKGAAAALCRQGRAAASQSAGFGQEAWRDREQKLGVQATGGKVSERGE